MVWDEKTEKYYAYFATATDVGREHPIGVVAMAESTDLLHWGNQQIVYTPRQNGMIEVPDVFEMDGKWYLTFLTGPHYAGRSLTDDDYVCNCTLYATADSPRGPLRGGTQQHPHRRKIKQRLHLPFCFEGRRSLPLLC